MSDRDVIISFRDCSFNHQGSLVLPKTNWEICKGSNWAVVGENGSGKRLLLRALEGKLPCSAGEAWFSPKSAPAGRPKVICIYPDSHRELTRGDSLPQARWESMFREGSPTVNEYLDEVSAKASEVANTIRLLRIEELLERRLISLSNGEGRKVCIAHALLRNPQVLVLSEPFLAVDKDYQEYLKAVLGSLMRTSLTVVLSVSDPSGLVPEVGHVVMLKDQQISFVGDVENAIRLFEKDRVVAKVPNAPGEAQPANLSGSIANVVVELKQVNLKYGTTEVLRELDWVLRDDERWVLLGPNGAGKSALISLLVGDNPQCYVNDVFFLGRQRGTGETVWDIKRQVGFVAPELFRIIPLHLTCLETVLSGYLQVPEFVGVATERQEQGALTALNFVGLDDQRQRPLGLLSQGCQRLVLLARAVVHKPALLVLDEPCENLDRSSRERFDRCLGAISSECDLPFVLATHRLKELPSCLTHVMVLEAGRVSQIWSPESQQELHYCDTD